MLGDKPSVSRWRTGGRYRRQEAGGEVINPSGNDPAIIAATTCATSQPPTPAMPPDNPDTDNNQNFTPDLGTIQYLYIFIRFVSPAHTNMYPEPCEVCGLYQEIPPIHQVMLLGDTASLKRGA